jgi:hypothetical protein
MGVVRISSICVRHDCMDCCAIADVGGLLKSGQREEMKAFIQELQYPHLMMMAGAQRDAD